MSAHSPAAAAGIEKGDIVTTLSAQRIDNADALVAAVRSHAPGDTVSVSYLRGTTTRTTSVHLGSATD